MRSKSTTNEIRLKGNLLIFHEAVNVSLNTADGITHLVFKHDRILNFDPNKRRFITIT